eukprot:CAMPEP_0113462902 /NCGR_PEP_ID=MMETSP0014_2-20120614/12354_1 /TAXON_ID=2857 /ORGANISM="Nitzschia sp." /LENGTH=1013 /DNA_ID=CAMNT_0000354825 /DNA_START=466 /DNA_END=3504 /DNA_ORIENTATION=+ /assembly_acc=CAM_ASM_000159
MTASATATATSTSTANTVPATATPTASNGAAAFATTSTGIMAINSSQNTNGTNGNVSNFRSPGVPRSGSIIPTLYSRPPPLPPPATSLVHTVTPPSAAGSGSQITPVARNHHPISHLTQGQRSLASNSQLVIGSSSTATGTSPKTSHRPVSVSRPIKTGGGPGGVGTVGGGFLIDHRHLKTAPPPPPTTTTSVIAMRKKQQPHLLQVVSEMAPVLREQLLYVAVKIEREDVTKPWGLGFAKHGQDRVLLTKANLAASSSQSSPSTTPPAEPLSLSNGTGSNAMSSSTSTFPVNPPSVVGLQNASVSWAHVIRVNDHVLLDPHTVYDKTAHGTAQRTDAYTEKLHKFVMPLSTIHQRHDSTTKMIDDGTTVNEVDGDKPDSQGQSPKDQSAEEHYDRRLLPGDLIMAVDGRSMQDFDEIADLHHIGPKPSETSLNSLTSYLRSAKSVCVVVLRMIPATKGKAVTNGTGSSQSPLIHAASNIRYIEWSRILPSPEIIHANPSPRKVSSSHQHRKNAHFQQSRCKPPPHVIVYLNPWFKERVDNAKMDCDKKKDKKTKFIKCIPYDDNFVDNSKEDGTRAALFLPRIDNLSDWMLRRKRTWRMRYSVQRQPANPSAGTNLDLDYYQDPERDLSTIARDFWTQQGFHSFEEWLETRVLSWRRSYSWNKRKKRRIQQECEAVIHLPCHPTVCEIQTWLKIRRNQWRIQTRKRQRLSSAVDCHTETDEVKTETLHPAEDSSSESNEVEGKTTHLWSSDQPREIAFIDEILEEADEERRKRVKRDPFDLKKFFDSTFGMPDDAIFVFLSFLPSKEHGKVLAIDRGTSKCLKERTEVWKQLCPSRWKLPRRPRKPYHILYLSNLRKEHELHQKRWDDLLIKIAGVLERSDAIQKVEKLVKAGEDEFGFEVNYISSVVMERNSILNLATIHRRHKVIRWLVEKKGADIESFDRGSFTPLANAAWAGDKVMVRYFMGKGSDRTIRCTQHSSQPIAPPEFMGLTPAEWAEKRGHSAIAKLIREG